MYPYEMLSSTAKLLRMQILGAKKSAHLAKRTDGKKRSRGLWKRMNNLIHSTWGIVEEFLQHGYVIESINCLEGLCKKVNFDRNPLDEVETRLRLAQILVKYTTNINRAKSHLEKADLKLSEIIGDEENDVRDAQTKQHHNIVQCRISKTLSDTYRLMGDAVLTIKAIKKGLVCAERGNSEGWRNVFRMELINTLIYSESETSNNNENILQLFSQAQKDAEHDLSMKIVCLLGEAQYRIQKSSLESAAQCLDRCEIDLKQLTSDNNSSDDKLEQANRSYLYLHYSVLKSLCMVRLNHFQNAKDAMLDLQKALKQFHASQVDTSKLKYSWMPLAAAFIVSLFLAGVYQSWIGFYDKSAQNYEKGLQRSDRQLQVLQDAAKGYIADLELSGQVQFCLIMKVYFYLQSAISSLCQFDMVDAIEHIRNAITCSVVDTELFHSFQFNIHVVVGIAASNLNCITEAVKHFDIVINKCDSPDLVAYAMIFKMAALLTQITEENKQEHLKAVFELLDILNTKKDCLKVGGINAAASLIRGISCSYSSEAIDDAEKYLNHSMNEFPLENKQFAARASILLGQVHIAKGESFDKIKTLLGTGITNGIQLKDLIAQLFGKRLYLDVYESEYKLKNAVAEDSEPLTDHQQVSEHQEEYDSAINRARIEASSVFKWFPNDRDEYPVIDELRNDK